MSPYRVKIGSLIAIVAGGLLCVACQRTTIDGLNVRAAPTTASAVVGSVAEVETRVEIECWTRGEPVRGDDVWFRIGAPYVGYVTNYYVQTTGDVMSAEDRC